LPTAVVSVLTRLWPRSALAGWARSTGRATRSPRRSRIASGVGNAVYAASGHIVIGGRVTQEGEILAVPDTARDGGSPRLPVAVQQNVFRSVRSATSWFDLWLTGTLVYAVADISRNSIVSVDQAARGLYADGRPRLLRCDACALTRCDEDCLRQALTQSRAEPEAIPTRMHPNFKWLEELKANVPIK